MEINPGNSNISSMGALFTDSYQEQVKEIGLAIANHDLVKVKDLLNQGVDVNSVLKLDKDLSITLMATSAKSSLQSYLEQYFQKGQTLIPCDSDDFSENFKILLSEAKTLIEEKKDLNQELLLDLVRVDCNEMNGVFFMVKAAIEGLEVSFLSLAKEFNNFEIAEFLIQEGADLYFKVLVGNHLMPIVELEEAADEDDIKFAELFQQNGVSMEYMTSEYFDNSPKKLLNAAQEKGNEVLVSFLEKNGYHF